MKLVTRNPAGAWTLVRALATSIAILGVVGATILAAPIASAAESLGQRALARARALGDRAGEAAALGDSYGLEATKQPVGAAVRMDPNFFSLALQAQYARAMTRSGQQALVRLDVQLAAQSLFALEQSSFGGIDSVRGYRRNQVLADNAVVGSLEYRAPLRDLMSWRRSPANGEATWFGAVFADGGYGWNTDLPNPAVRSIASAGASLTWRPTQRLSAQFYAAKRLLNDSAPNDKRLQDYGVGFRITQRI